MAGDEAGHRPFVSNMNEVRIALLSLPWYNPSTPCIQTGALKAYVESLGQARVDCYSLHVDILRRVSLEHAIRMGTDGIWVGEGIFAEALFPDTLERRSLFLEREYSKLGISNLSVTDTADAARSCLDASLRAIDFDSYDLVGISVVYGQTFSSLYAAQQIKSRSNVPVILGGPAVVGRVGLSLLKAFPYLDAVINGEGELPLSRIAEQMANGSDWLHVDGVLHRGMSRPPVFSELASLNVLPDPNYDEYFDKLGVLGSPPLCEVRLPIETSRGCWWDRSSRNPALACTFCNLNLQWRAYREKSVPTAIDTFARLRRRYGLSNFLVVDNILRTHDTQAFLEELARTGPLSISMEARAHIGASVLLALSAAGVTEIQFGIEALHTPILKAINKGTTAIQNIRAMKFCRDLGIKSASNIITRIPGVSQRLVDDQLQHLDYVWSYQPLSIATFCLVEGSPLSKSSVEAGIIDVGNHAAYSALLPPGIEQSLFFLERRFRAEIADWSATERQVIAWQKAWERDSPPSLESYANEGRLIIRDSRSLSACTVLLDESASQIYNLAHDIADIAHVAQELNIPVDTARTVAKELHERKLAFLEGNRILALAIPQRLPSPSLQEVAGA